MDAYFGKRLRLRGPIARKAGAPGDPDRRLAAKCSGNWPKRCRSSPGLLLGPERMAGRGPRPDRTTPMVMTFSQLSDYRRRIEDDLRGNILPFWMQPVLKRPGGGFIGALSNDLVPDTAAERGALLTSRILWTFAAAHAAY